MSAQEPDSSPPLTHLPQRFVRHILSFFVALAIGLAPFLGTRNVPGFKALISVMPFQDRSELITLSAFLMGLIVVAIQFYSEERISRPLLRKLFGISFVTLVTGFVLFYFLRGEFTETVDRGNKRITVLVGSAPISSCKCPNPQNTVGCIQHLSLTPDAIASCWERREIKRRGQILGLSYLILTGGVGVLIGFLMLQEKLRREEKRKEQTKKQGAQKQDRAKQATPRAPKKSASSASKPKKNARPTPAPGPQETKPPNERS
ncbi:MAG TPA: hypothetical protein VF789_29665 [Thermoanaerobaculia bacterium]